TPEQTAFLARLGRRLAGLTGSLGPDAFSLNRAAEELRGLVEDVTTFARQQAPLAELETWHAEARTAIVLELAVARLPAVGSAPGMPRFAARLAAALGAPPPAEWPRGVALVAPGTRIDLARQVFFGEPAERPLLPWLSDEAARRGVGEDGRPVSG